MKQTHTTLILNGLLSGYLVIDFEEFSYHDKPYKIVVTTALPHHPLVGGSLVTRPRFDCEKGTVFLVSQKHGSDLWPEL